MMLVISRLGTVPASTQRRGKAFNPALLSDLRGAGFDGLIISRSSKNVLGLVAGVNL